MSLKDRLYIKKVESLEDRERALDVLSVVYSDEKHWVENRDRLLPMEDMGSEEVSWFSVWLEDQIVGVTRVLYKIPTELYEKYGFKLLIPGLNVKDFIANNKIAEVGRFAVLPIYRKKIFVAALLMRAAGTETLQKGFSHFITDVFENDPNTPYGFHQRVLGFKEVATHEVGELHCQSRRITMLLDLKDALKCMKRRKGWFFRFVTEGWSEQAVRQLCAN